VAHRDHRDDPQAGRLSDRILTRRALNRALLARQLLLGRSELSVGRAIEHLIGLQAQATLPPYIGLWSRVQGFDPDELGRMLANREVVRLTLMRGTVHLVTSRDAHVLRPLVQNVVERSHKGAFGRRMGGATPEKLAAAVEELLAVESLGARELGRRLVALGIGDDPEAIGNAARVYVPLVQVPPRGVWGASGRAFYATLEGWTGRQLRKRPSIDTLVLRYLGAFGPASVMDMQKWSGLTRLKAAFERLRPKLATFREEGGAELFDLPDAPRPDPDRRAPVRFLPEYDNLLLSHDDRSRFVSASDRALLGPGWSVAWGAVLHDGLVRGAWRVQPDGLAVRHVPLAKRGLAAIAAEGRRLARFLGTEAGVRLEPVSR
jgi:Winged helix DNA-binding domain